LHFRSPLSCSILSAVSSLFIRADNLAAGAASCRLMSSSALGNSHPKHALKALPTPRTRGAIPNWRSTPILHHPRGRIRGRGRERSASRVASEALGWCQRVSTIEDSDVCTTDRINTPSPDPSAAIFPPSSPTSRNYGGQAGRLICLLRPGLKAWAVVYNRFAVNPTSVDFSSSGLAGEFRIPRDAQPVRELRS
jgi:hypothetical protein